MRAGLFSLWLLLASGPRDEVGGDPTTLRVVEDGASSLSDPRRASDAWAISLFDALLCHVLAIGPDGRLAPDLALAWRLASPTRLRLDLDAAATIEDGTAITADTVAAGPRALADLSHGGIHGPALTGILAVEVINRHRLELIPRASDPALVQRLHLLILHPRDATAPRIAWPRSSGGPYRLAEHPDPGTPRLEATSTVPATAPPAVLVRAEPDAFARGFALEATAADLALNAVAPEDLALLADLPHLAVDRHSGWNVSDLSFRTDRPQPDGDYRAFAKTRWVAP